MSNVEPSKRNFFPHSKVESPRPKKAQGLSKTYFERNSTDRKSELDKMASADSKVTIPEAVKDFSRIKSAVDAAPPADNAAKIAKLKQQIQSGNYRVNYEAVADKLLQQEF